MKRIPVLATLLVLVAVGVMLRLGFWQLERLTQKEALLRQYRAAQAMSSEIVFPLDPEVRARFLYRHTSFDCPTNGEVRPMAGRSAAGEVGWAHWSTCEFADGAKAEVNIGWAREPRNLRWTGAMIRGVIAPDGPGGGRVVSDQPQAGLAAAETADPSRLTNNHLSYAVQWFLFALTALVIYALALRKRLAASGAGG
jgi:surfeit locus 1 family protein